MGIFIWVGVALLIGALSVPYLNLQITEKRKRMAMVILAVLAILTFIFLGSY